MNRIHEFIRNNKNQKVGILVADIENDLKTNMVTKDLTVRYGWSRVNINSGDIFDRTRGMEIAVSRLEAQETVPIPRSMVCSMDNFKSRTRRYFKDARFYMTVPIQQVENTH